MSSLMTASPYGAVPRRGAGIEIFVPPDQHYPDWPLPAEYLRAGLAGRAVTLAREAALLPWRIEDAQEALRAAQAALDGTG